MMSKIKFDIAYGEYLEATYPKLYEKGIHLAVEQHGFNPKSIAAHWWALGYVEGSLPIAIGLSGIH